MQAFICNTCGTQYPPTTEPPARCAICDEERQYVHPDGQTWTTLEMMRESGRYHNEIIHDEEGLYSITTNPRFAIGQTTYLVQDQGFNVLWDCIAYLDEKTVAEVKKLGGVQAIALSHPHYYSTMVEWAETFDAPIYIHTDDKEWVMRPSDYIQFWTGESLQLSEGMTLHRLGGHFKGGAVLHWETGNAGKGILLTGDIIEVVADRQWVSFMYSFPNLIPLPARKVAEIAEKVAGLKFDRIYNAFHRVVVRNANQSVQKSAERYIAALEGRLFST
ncbi:MBL fold metallo-hydrolase [Thermoactinomyces sp. CICC 10521]|uniref:MBL fold metallo-hydrolase n=1 Tax=Thermoactinomyces sp. CICC 10521 TaxID=2767426 RepID=UPI0018DE94E4|nr:MBL fold metallo-hydrolase [Thermoactinomyces sp. CICC 10521]MBH8608370.1 MBL fold metallo-hydrolase [Thermoactinomyces sp. CICC 10521]